MATGVDEVRNLTTSEFSRRTRLLARLAVLLAPVALSFAFGAVPASGDAYPDRYGMRYLQTGCCAGQPLGGTTASLNVQSMSPNAGCMLFRSDSETASHLLQAGIAKCASGYTLDGTCSTSNNVILFVETNNNGAYHCYSHGAASLNTEYVPSEHVSGSTWYSFISGTGYETLSMGTQAAIILEGGEHTLSGVACSSWSASARFAGDSNKPWQRFNLQAQGITVGSSQTNFGCYTITGGPPGTFNISN